MKEPIDQVRHAVAMINHTILEECGLPIEKAGNLMCIHQETHWVYSEVMWMGICIYKYQHPEIVPSNIEEILKARIKAHCDTINKMAQKL